MKNKNLPGTPTRRNFSRYVPTPESRLDKQLFNDLVCKVAANISPGRNFNADALHAIQVASEQYLSELFHSDSIQLMQDRTRTTKAKNRSLLSKIRGPR